MVSGKEHDQIATRLAKKHKVPYNRGQGPDIQTPELVIEVEGSVAMLSQGVQQLQGFQKPRYIAVPDELLPAAIKRFKETKIGVMDSSYSR